MFSPGLYTEGFNGTDASFGIEDHYPSSEFGDDLFWASTWLYRASINSIRSFNDSYYREAMSTTMSLACAPPPHPPFLPTEIGKLDSRWLSAAFPGEPFVHQPRCGCQECGFLG